jgi:hypothetical protein
MKSRVFQDSLPGRAVASVAADLVAAPDEQRVRTHDAAVLSSRQWRSESRCGGGRAGESEASTRFANANARVATEYRSALPHRSGQRRCSAPRLPPTRSWCLPPTASSPARRAGRSPLFGLRKQVRGALAVRARVTFSVRYAGRRSLRSIHARSLASRRSLRPRPHSAIRCPTTSSSGPRHVGMYRRSSSSDRRHLPLTWT